jgi:hypothetical protein
VTTLTIAEINGQITALWDEQFGSTQKPVYWPMISPPSSVQNGLTVVGCNPALPRYGYYTDKIPFFQRTSESERQKIQEKLADLEATARKTYRYYRPLRILANDLGLHGKMEHVDLFFIEKQHRIISKILF